jgi:hypothetical protein
MLTIDTFVACNVALAVAEPIVIAYYPVGRTGIIAQTCILAFASACFVIQVLCTDFLRLRRAAAAKAAAAAQAEAQAQARAQQAAAAGSTESGTASGSGKQNEGGPSSRFSMRFRSTVRNVAALNPSFNFVADFILALFALSRYIYHKGDFLFELVCFLFGKHV